MSEPVRIVTVVNWRRGSVHGSTRDDSKAQQWVRDICEQTADPVGATMTVDLIEIPDVIAAAEARGRQQAIDALRDDERYGAWLSQIRPGDGRYWDMDRPGRQLADYLESISTPDGSVT